MFNNFNNNNNNNPYRNGNNNMMYGNTMQQPVQQQQQIDPLVQMENELLNILPNTENSTKSVIFLTAIFEQLLIDSIKDPNVLNKSIYAQFQSSLIGQESFSIIICLEVDMNFRAITHTILTKEEAGLLGIMYKPYTDSDLTRSFFYSSIEKQMKSSFSVSEFTNDLSIYIDKMTRYINELYVRSNNNENAVNDRIKMMYFQYAGMIIKPRLVRNNQTGKVQIVYQYELSRTISTRIKGDAVS